MKIHYLPLYVLIIDGNKAVKKSLVTGEQIAVNAKAELERAKALQEKQFYFRPYQSPYYTRVLEALNALD